MVKAVLHRLHDNSKQTIGTMVLIDSFGNPIATLSTLELPDKDNATGVSCIPIGTYNVTLRDSDKFGLKGFYHVENVVGREAIGIHRGNYYTDIRGCILVGLSHTFINKDNNLDVVNSTEAFKKLRSLVGDSFQLQII